MANETARGIVKSDPAKNARAGEKFKFSFERFSHDKESKSGDLDQWDYFGSALIGLRFEDADGHVADGSAILVSPGIAISAKHVIDERLKNLMSSFTKVMAFSIIGDNKILIWDVQEVMLGDTDVAILRLDLRSDFPKDGIVCAKITTRTPTIGEQVMFAGVKGISKVCTGEPAPAQVRVGVGEVTALYLEGRDSVMNPHPCIEVKCLTLGGMSGGPAFDKDGHLVGILTSSFEHELGPSYCSLWWPMANHAIGSTWLTGSVTLPTNLLQLNAAGLARIIGPEAISLHSDGSFNFLIWN